MKRPSTHSYPNPVSRYDEDVVVYGLTLYELDRAPRRAAREIVQVDLERVRGDCQCSICLGILQNTTTVMECTHRFCKNCIETSLRTHKNECPTCRLHIPSRRSLRPDSGFDALVRLLYQDVESFEKSEIERVQELRANSIAELAMKVKQGMEKQRKAARALESTTSTSSITTRGARSEVVGSTVPPVPRAILITPAVAEARRRLEKRRRVARENDVELALFRHPLESEARSVIRREESIIMVPPEFTMRAARTFLQDKLRAWGEECEGRVVSFCTRDVYGFDHEWNRENETVEDLLRLEGRSRTLGEERTVRSLVVYYRLSSP